MVATPSPNVSTPGTRRLWPKEPRPYNQQPSLSRPQSFDLCLGLNTIAMDTGRRGQSTLRLEWMIR